MVSTIKQYLRTDLVPEYIDVKLIQHSQNNARTYLSNLNSLIASIKQNGLLQPIIVRLSGSRFEIVAGNRRLEACKKLHWVKIPCLVRELSDKEAYEIGLIENIERETLTPIEEARSFQLYIKQKGWGGVKSLAEKIGRSEEYVSHRIALLGLPKIVLELISSDKLSPSAAHEIVWMKNADEQKMLAKTAAELGLPAKKVREAVVLSKSGQKMDDIVSAMDSRELGRVKDAAEKQSKLLDKSILTLRICILRLDSIIEEIDNETGSESLRQILIQKRLLVHNEIDDLIHLKKSMAARSV
ncbi:MAG: ParB/RepB/Spo0J family partition protein [Nitrososphaerota archaeon]|nr:ParB/RepB/Spo0J family partition protein [Nitrososphaerota archaeon]